jgi:hypothetical protein
MTDRAPRVFTRHSPPKPVATPKRRTTRKLTPEALRREEHEAADRLARLLDQMRRIAP